MTIRYAALAVLLTAACSDDPASDGDVAVDTMEDTSEDSTDAVAPDTMSPEDGADPDDTAEPDDTSPTDGSDTAGGDVCAEQPNGVDCDDGNACTENTTCSGEVCGGGNPVSCKVTDDCVSASCNPVIGCVASPMPDGTACDRHCFEEASCQSGVCVGDVAVTCPASTDDCVAEYLCNPDTGLCTDQQWTATGTPCDLDNNVCTEDTCELGQCYANVTNTCSAEAAANPCEAYQCDAVDGCVVSGTAPNGASCGTGMVCDDGECVEEGCQTGCGEPLACPTLSAGVDAPDDIRSGPLSLVGGASIHVIGGSPSKQHFVYTPGSGWTNGTPLEDGVREGGGAVIGTKWFIVDGDENEGVRIYDLVMGEWSLGAERPAAPPRGPAVGTDGTYLFVAGGADGNLNGTTITHRYNPAADSWSTVSPMPTARGFIAHAVVGDRLYAIGGRDKQLTGSTIVDATEAYDMTTDTWHTLEDMPTKRNSAFATAVGQHIVVAGGFSGSTQVDTIEIYDTVSDTWQTCATGMSSAFSGGTIATLNGEIYIFGGGADELGVEIGTFP